MQNIFLMLLIFSSTFLRAQNSLINYNVEFDKVIQNDLEGAKLILDKQKKQLNLSKSNQNEEKFYYYRNLSSYYALKSLPDSALYYSKKSSKYALLGRNEKQIASSKNSLALRYKSLNHLDSALVEIIEALKHFENLGDTNNLANCLHTKATILRLKSKHKEAISALVYALSKLSCNSNFKMSNEYGIMLNSVGLNYYDLHKLDSAYFYYIKSLAYFEKNGSPREILRCSDQIGAVLFELDRLEDAKQYFNKSLLIATKLKDRVLIANSKLNLGAIHFENKDFEKSIKYFSESLEVYESHQLKGYQSICYNNLAEAFQILGDEKMALEYALKSLTLEKSIGNNYFIAQASALVGKLYLKTLNYQKAEHYLLDGLKHSTSLESEKVKMDIYQNLYELSSAMNNYKSALFYLEEYTRLKNKFTNAEVQRNIDSLKVKYETKIISGENKSLKLSNKNKQIQIELERANYNRIILIVIALLSAMLVVIIFLKNKNTIRKKKIEILGLEAKIKNSALENAKQDLNQLKINLFEKSKVVEVLSRKLSFQQDSKKVAQDLIKDLKVENSWAQFINQFEIVYPGFVDKVQKEYPMLTNNDLRMVILIKLGLTTKEMSEILFITSEGVTKSKQRLKKKIGLDGDLDSSIKLL